MILPGHILAFFLAAGLLQPAQTPAPTPPVVSTAEPVYGPSHVESSELHLRFDLPEGVQSRKDLADEADRKFEKKSASGEPCLSVPVLAFDPKVLRRIYFYRYNGACFTEPVSQDQLRSTALRALTAMLHHSGHESMSSPLDYKLGSHPAAVISGNVYSEENHGILFAEATCSAVEKDMACWAFVASNPAKVARLAALPLQFDGHSPEPIIPEDMSQMVALPTLTFHDDDRHIEFTYPGVFASAQARAVDIIAKKTEEASVTTKAALSCMKVLLSADELTDDLHSNIFIFSFTAACAKLTVSPTTLRGFTLGIAKGYAKVAPAEIGTVVPYTLAGHDAAVITALLQPSGKPVSHVSTTCTIVGSDFVCWQVTSTSPDRLRSLLASTVSFDRGLGVPLVPAQLANTPGPQTK